MARRFNRDVLKQSVKLRQQFLTTVESFQLKQADRTAHDLDAIHQGYRQFAASLGELDEAVILERFAHALQVATHLCNWAYASLAAAPDAQRFRTAAQANCAVLQGAIDSPKTSTEAALFDWCLQANSLDSIVQVSPILISLAHIPLPIAYSQGVSGHRPDTVDNSSRVTPDQSATVIAKLTFRLDGQPLDTPKAIRSSTQYDLTVEMVVDSWPAEFDTLQVDFISTMTPTRYWLTPFSFSRANGNIQSDKGHCIFHDAQSLLSEPAVIRVRALFVSNSNGGLHQVRVVGHPELRIRILDEKSYPVLTGYPVVDIQIPKLVQEAYQALPDLNPADFANFERCLVYLSRYAASVLQTGVFKGRKIHETKDFQQDLLRYLRGTELGSVVREGERVVGGVMDLEYRGIVIELKVETAIEDRDVLRSRYIEQAAQYTAHSLPLSIACILDMTEKHHPPANLANNITLETPTLHGFAQSRPTYPSKVAVIIIDGNLKSPSDYS